MKLLNNLTIKNLKLNKKRTIVTIVGIILSTALMVGIGLLFSTFQNYMIEEVIQYNGRYQAKYLDISKEELEIIKNKDNLTYFYEEGLGFSKINSSYEYKPYLYIEEVNKEYFDELNLTQGRYPENNDEIIISNHIYNNRNVEYNVGDIITLDYGYREINGVKYYSNGEYTQDEKLVITNSHEYTIVGIVSRSNYEEYSACGYSVFTLNEDVNDNVNAYVVFDKKSNIMKQAKDLASEINYDENSISYNSTLLALYGESGYSNIMSSMMGMLVIMLALVSVGCIIVIYNSFAISVMERKKEFGLLSSVGTTRKQLSYTVFFEAIFVGIIGIALGIIGAYIGIGIVVFILNNLLTGVLECKLQLITMPVFIAIPVIFMVAVILISAIIPSRRASKVSPIEAIRQNDDIKINKKRIKTSKLVTKVFGIEGEIALKNIKRNKKKYRVTIISLFISIVLFISFSAYMNYTLNTAENMASNYAYDINIYSYSENDEVDEKINEIIYNDEVQKFAKYSIVTVPIKRTVNYTDEYLKYSSERFSDSFDDFKNQNYDYINLIVLDDNSYNEYKKEIGLFEDKIILFNNYQGVTYRSDKRTNYDIDVIKDNNVSLSLCDFKNIEDNEDVEQNIDNYCQEKINNIFITNKGYTLISEISGINEYKLIVNNKIFDVIKTSEVIDSYIVNIVSDNYNNIDELGKELKKEDGVFYTNIEESAKMSSNIILAVKILMYGFISLVTLIGVTSVFNTISTSMALRKKEFAILRSIGLNRKGFNKILFFESLFFGIKSLLYSLPVSFGVIVLIHISLSGMVNRSSIMIPWNSILLTIFMVFIIVLLTMLYSTNKIKKHNILEQIREENI